MIRAFLENEEAIQAYLATSEELARREVENVDSGEWWHDARDKVEAINGLLNSKSWADCLLPMLVRGIENAVGADEMQVARTLLKLFETPYAERSAIKDNLKQKNKTDG